MICCDTSFLLALYVESDRFHPQANKIAARFKEPFSLTLLLELELQNGIRRTLAAGSISRQEHDAILRQIDADESDGILRRYLLASTEHYAKARELSKRHTPQLSCRSLDILHVAAALLLKAEEFASFDDRQRQLAEKAGLKLLPR
jgi:predicted nucleic acid-binding protein